MKRPDEIKQSIMCCYGDPTTKKCKECAYSRLQENPDCEEAMALDALGLIEQLERQNAELAARIELGKVLEEQLKRERDAAIKDIPRACGYCKHYLGDAYLPICENWDCKMVSGVNTGWEWRGVPQEVEHD